MAHKNHKMFLIDMLPKKSIGAEIGVWTGKFSKHILSRVKPKRYCLIDPWKFMSKYPKRWYGGSRATSQLDMDKIFSDIKKEFGQEPGVEIYRMTASIAANNFSDSCFDWVYVDGDHSYKEVRKDILNYYKLVKPGGLVCGDDWQLPGVRKAVNETLENDHKVHSHTHQWWIIKPENKIDIGG